MACPVATFEDARVDFVFLDVGIVSSPHRLSDFQNICVAFHFYKSDFCHRFRNHADRSEVGGGLNGRQNGYDGGFDNFYFNSVVFIIINCTLLIPLPFFD